MQRPAERSAGVPGRGLDPHRVERALCRDARVGHAIERHAAGECQIAIAGLLVQPADQIQQHFFEHCLHARGEIGMIGGPLFGRIAALDQHVPVHPGRGESAVAGGVHEAAQMVEVPRLAV